MAAGMITGQKEYIIKGREKRKWELFPEMSHGDVLTAPLLIFLTGSMSDSASVLVDVSHCTTYAAGSHDRDKYSWDCCIVKHSPSYINMAKTSS